MNTMSDQYMAQLEILDDFVDLNAAVVNVDKVELEGP